MSAPGPDVLRSSSSRELAFLLTDIEGSTVLWDRDRETASEAVARHDQILATEVAAHYGTLIRSRGEGDSTFSVFERPGDAVACGLAIIRALEREPWRSSASIRVRAAVHLGTVEVRDGDLFGSAINRCARLRSIAHGGQVVLSSTAASATRDVLPIGASLRDLGVHGLRGLSRPERVFQLCHPDIRPNFPPLASSDAARHNIPTPLTSFVGRDREIEQVTAMLDTDRLVTLTGVGGSGKTRLGFRVASEVVDRFDDGVWIVELAAVRDGGLVPSAVASVLNLREEPGVDIVETLAARLEERCLLLVLDNCEHLVGACSALIARLLTSCPDLRVLTTSRETLGLIGESVHALAPLDAPDPRTVRSAEDALRYDAIKLFVGRACSRRPSFELDAEAARGIAELCGHLDGIPLAIELAATRAAVLGIGEVTARLSDRFSVLTGGERGSGRETLLETLDWSYDLLPADERALYAQLSVFAGRFTLADVEAVCDLAQALDTVQRLIDKSLIAPSSDGVFALLETVRAHALTKVSPSVDERIRDRHMHHFLERSSRSAQSLASEVSTAIPRLEADHDNIRAALAWSLSREPRGDTALRFVGVLWPFWVWHGHHTEGRAWTERALLDRPERATNEFALALRAAGVLAVEQGDFEVGVQRFREALAIHSELGNPEMEAWLLNALGVVADRRGQYDDAVDLFQQSLALHRAQENRAGEAVTLGNLGATLGRTGAFDTARDSLEQGIALSRSLGLEVQVAGALGELGLVMLAEGRIDDADVLLREALRLEADLEARVYLATALDGLAGVAVARGDPTRAVMLLRVADAVRETMGLALTASERSRRQRIGDDARAALGPHGFRAVWETPGLALDQGIEFALGEGSST